MKFLKSVGEHLLIAVFIAIFISAAAMTGILLRACHRIIEQVQIETSK